MKLTRTEVIDVIARRGELEGVDLSGLDLTGVAFDGLSLKRADLTSCDLSRADFRYCDLSGATFRSACLTDAEFGSAKLLNASLADAAIDCARSLWNAHCVIDAGFDVRGYRFVGVRHDHGWMVKAGCRWFDMHKAQLHWERKANVDALARLNVIKGMVIATEVPQVPGFVQ
jgi:pentapeptide repeat protein